MARKKNQNYGDGGVRPNSPSGKKGRPARWNPITRREERQRVRAINARRRARTRAYNQRQREKAARINAERTKAADYRFNEGYLNDMAAADQRRQAALSNYAAQERETGIAYGLGQYGGSAINNPYSRAAMLQRSYDQSQRASTNQLASAGQLYSGAMSNARAANVGQFSQQRDSLEKDFDARTAQAAAGRAQAQADYDRARAVAEQKARQEAAKLFPVDRNNAPILAKPKLRKPNLAKPRFRRGLPPKRNRPNRPSGGIGPPPAQ